jgi:cytochrome P450
MPFTEASLIMPLKTAHVEHDTPSDTRQAPRKPAANPHDAGAAPFQFLMDLTRRVGDVATYQTPYGPVYLFNHPEHVDQILKRENYIRAALVKLALGDGLLSSDGPYHRQQRRLMQPGFQKHRIDGFGPIITSATTAMLEQWQSYAAREEPLNVATEMQKLALTIVVKALFSVDIEEQADELTAAVSTIIEDLGRISCTLLNFPLTLGAARNKEFQHALGTVDHIVYDIIRRRREQPDETDDLLSLLMQARDGQTGEPLSERQLRDEVVTVLIAGHETTALTLSWTWYSLAENPAVLQRLHAELATVLNGRLPTVDDLPHLAYMRMTIHETMRLYPPVWFMVRQALHSDCIGGHEVPAKAFVLVSAYTTHRHPDFWKDPERFDPEHCTPEAMKQRPPGAYFPFAGGRHLCLGHHFAMLESVLIVATMAQAYQLQLVPEHAVVPHAALTLRQRDGMLATPGAHSAAPAA